MAIGHNELWRVEAEGLKSCPWQWLKNDHSVNTGYNYTQVFYAGDGSIGEAKSSALPGILLTTTLNYVAAFDNSDMWRPEA